MPRIVRFFEQITTPASSDKYAWPNDPKVRANLDRWQDLKFGVIIHWGLDSVPGIVESWTLCQEDWINRPPGKTYEEYKAWYWGLARSFNPRRFDPDQWAEAARRAGMRYVVFTTKHHDGFCLFDTQETDFKVTGGPFADDPRADVARLVFDAFRARDFMIGAYFSKPDWHSDDFWWDEHPTPNRNINYDPRKHPARWNRFRMFTQRQIEEETSCSESAPDRTAPFPTRSSKPLTISANGWRRTAPPSTRRDPPRRTTTGRPSSRGKRTGPSTHWSGSPKEARSPRP